MPSDISAAVRRTADETPEHLAMLDDGTAVTYGELMADVDRRCDTLRSAGLQPGERVALVAESSPAYIATALAVWQAGGVLVTIYPSSGRDDLVYALTSSDPCVVVVSASVSTELVAEALPSTPTASVEVFDVATLRKDTQPNPEDVADRLSLICFSSGTTSRPKAIMLTGEAVLNYAQTYAEVWHFAPEDRGIVCLPMAWMYGLAGTTLALLVSGATAVVVRRAQPALLVDAVTATGATFLAGVTTTFAKMVEHLESTPSAAEQLASLRLCISGGEPRNESAFARWRELTGVSVLDAYCSSECLPLVTYDPHIDPDPVPGSAGKLVPRARLRVVRPDGSEVRPGEVGEALTSGPGLMLGYWRDPAQTAAALTDDGWYRTNDLVRIDEDGYVYVVGRLSDLIIRGGVNISPAEVERAIREFPGVADVAVVGLPDPIYGQQVVAAVVPRAGLDGGELDLDALDAHVRGGLTSYKVPNRYVLVDSLAVNATTGKVNRRAVADALAARADHASA